MPVRSVGPDKTRWSALLLELRFLPRLAIRGEPIEDDAPGWLHLAVLWAIWNMLKMLWIGPVSAVLLIRARVREAVATRRGGASMTAEANDAEEGAVVDAVGIR